MTQEELDQWIEANPAKVRHLSHQEVSRCKKCRLHTTGKKAKVTHEDWKPSCIMAMLNPKERAEVERLLRLKEAEAAWQFSYECKMRNQKLMQNKVPGHAAASSAVIPEYQGDTIANFDSVTGVLDSSQVESLHVDGRTAGAPDELPDHQGFSAPTDAAQEGTVGRSTASGEVGATGGSPTSAGSPRVRTHRGPTPPARRGFAAVITTMMVQQILVAQSAHAQVLYAEKHPGNIPEYSDLLSPEYEFLQLTSPLLQERHSFRSMALIGELHAYVTRKMTAMEKQSSRGREAQMDELRKLLDVHKLVGPPVSGNDVKNPKATMLGLAMLGFVKHAERELASQVFKGRAVLLGDQIRYVHSGVPIGKEAHWWELLASTPASLEESRVLDSYAVITGYDLEAVDFESAYLQSKWPNDDPAQETYVRITSTLFEFLPDELQPGDIQFPLWPLRKAGYGHPASGHLWAKVLETWLLEHGWKSIGRPGKGCLFAREVEGKRPMLACVYVDDMKVAGPTKELSEFWNEIAHPEHGAFTWKEKPAPVSEFLGAKYVRKVEQRDGIDFDVLRVDLTDYIHTTVADYEKLIRGGKKVRSRGVSSTATTRIPIKLRPPTHPPRREHQVIIGRLLWIMRVMRPDIDEEVSGLGSRVSCWDRNCDLQLDCLMGYLKRTAGYQLEFAWPVQCQGATGQIIRAEVHSDADWRGSEKSQSSFMCWVSPDERLLPNIVPQKERMHVDDVASGVFGGCPIHWMSKKQTITATSAADAEIVATYLAFTEGAWPLITLLSCLGMDETDWTLLVDNDTAKGNMDKKTSEVYGQKAKAVDCKEGFLHDMHVLGRYKAGHVHTELNRADCGTKKPKGVGQMNVWRARLGLALPVDMAYEDRRADWKLFNATTPPPKELLDELGSDVEELEPDFDVPWGSDLTPAAQATPAKPKKVPTAAAAAYSHMNTKKRSARLARLKSKLQSNARRRERLERAVTLLSAMDVEPTQAVQAGWSPSSWLPSLSTFV